jgi:hypothetical protein
MEEVKVLELKLADQLQRKQERIQVLRNRKSEQEDLKKGMVRVEHMVDLRQ